MSAAFSKLRESAKQIKTTSDELTRIVHGIEVALGRLDLRVACFTVLSEWTANDEDEFRREYVGYVDVRPNDWRIVVRITEGYESRPDEAHERTWLFDNAPQYLRIRAVEKLPDLVEGLAATVDKTTERLQKKIAPAQELANAIERPQSLLGALKVIAATPVVMPPPAASNVRVTAPVASVGKTPVTPTVSAAPPPIKPVGRK